MFFIQCTRQNQATDKTAANSEGKARKAAVAVQVMKPQRQDLVRKITLPGSLVAYEQATLYAKVAGYLKWIKVDKGDAVKKGEVLALIEVPEMGQEYEQAKAQLEEVKADLERARADYDQAQSEYGLQEVTYKRIKEVREQEPDVIPQQDVDVARGQFEVARSKINVAKSKVAAAQAKVNTARASLERTSTLMDYAKIRAPFNGVVTQRFVDPGALIQTATASQTQVASVATVMNMDIVRIYVEVPEREVPFVRKGNPITVTVDALPGKTFSGAVTRFTTALDPATRTMKTEIQIANRDHSLRPGMYGSIVLELEKRPNVLTIPAASLAVEGDKKFVYTVANNKAKKTAVNIGFDDGTRVEITQGLTGNEDIIINKGSITDGMEVKITS
jgi:RND family efflux transporter MFP subunit